MRHNMMLHMAMRHRLPQVSSSHKNSLSGFERWFSVSCIVSSPISAGLLTVQLACTQDHSLGLHAHFHTLKTSSICIYRLLFQSLRKPIEGVDIGLQSKADGLCIIIIIIILSLKFHGKGVFFQLNILRIRAVAVFSNSIWNLDP